MAARRIMVGDQEVEIPDFNFKLTPVILIFFIILIKKMAKIAG